MEKRLENVFAVSNDIPEKDRSLAADYEALAKRIDKEVRNPLHKVGALKALQDSRDEFMLSAMKDDKRRLQLEATAKHNQAAQEALQKQQAALLAEAAELRGEADEVEAEAAALEQAAPPAESPKVEGQASE